MKRFKLNQDTQGFVKGTIFEGPHLLNETFQTYGYFPEGGDPNSTFCFYESYVNDNPTLFTEIEKSPDENQGIVVN